jgi:mannose-6-phosphate isomerase-like protein (cupin superfamily)
MLIRRFSNLDWENKKDIKGGTGPGIGAPYLKAGDMDQVIAAGRTVLEPGSSVGEHAHPASEELWLILAGHGTGILDGERFPVEAGDLFVVKAGHAHGLVNDSPEPLAYFGLVTPKAEPKEEAPEAL